MWMSRSGLRRVGVLFVLGLPACSQNRDAPAAVSAAAGAPAAAATPAAPSSTAAALDAQLIGERLGVTPSALPGGVLTATLSRSGMSINVEGKPSMLALNTELAFRPVAAGAALSGSVELFEDELSPVLDTLLAHGVRVVGLYNRFLYAEPHVLVLRFEGQGNPALLASGAQSISSVLRDARLRSPKPLRELPGDAPEPGKLNAGALGGVLGVTASSKDGTVLIDVPRPPEAAGAPTLTAAASAAPLLHASFAGSDLRAVLNGTFVLTAQEVSPVLAALRTANVHLVGLVPQGPSADGGWFFLHFRGKNNSLSLVRGLAQALQARSARP